MTGRHVRCRGRVVLTADEVDENGWLTGAATMRVVGAILDSTPMAELEVDLGTTRHVDLRLVEALVEGIRTGDIYVTLVGLPHVARAYDQAVAERAARVLT